MIISCHIDLALFHVFPIIVLYKFVKSEARNACAVNACLQIQLQIPNLKSSIVIHVVMIAQRKMLALLTCLLRQLTGDTELRTKKDCV